jgi:hypothetical protein
MRTVARITTDRSKDHGSVERPRIGRKTTDRSKDHGSVERPRIGRKTTDRSRDHGSVERFIMDETESFQDVSPGERSGKTSKGGVERGRGGEGRGCDRERWEIKRERKRTGKAKGTWDENLMWEGLGKRVTLLTESGYWIVLQHMPL